MREKRIPNATVVIFTVFWNYILFSYFFLNDFLKVYKNNLYLIAVFFFITAIILFIPIKKISNKSNILKKVIHHKFISIPISIYALLNTILTLTIGMKFCKSVFFSDVSALLILFVVVGAILILAKRGVKNIFSTSFLFFFVITVLIVGTSFLNLRQKDFGMLLPFDFEMNIDFSILYYVFTVLDILLIFITSNFYCDKFRKKTVFKSIIYIMIMILLYGIDFITQFGATFLLDYEFIGLAVFQIQQTFGYLGDLNFLFLLLLTYIMLFRCSYFVYLFNTLPKFKNKNNRFLIIGIILFVSAYFLFLNFRYLTYYYKYIIVGFIILLLPYYLYLIFRKKDEELQYV